MLYVMTLKWQEGLTREQRDGALARRAQWEPPAAAKIVGEYWPASSDLAVVVIFEADSMEPIFEIGLAWEDVFKLNVFPAITAEEGLKMGPQLLSRRTV